LILFGILLLTTILLNYKFLQPFESSIPSFVFTFLHTPARISNCSNVTLNSSKVNTTPRFCGITIMSYPRNSFGVANLNNSRIRRLSLLRSTAPPILWLTTNPNREKCLCSVSLRYVITDMPLELYRLPFLNTVSNSRSFVNLCVRRYLYLWF